MNAARARARAGWLGLYILDGHTPVPCRSVLAWGEWHHENIGARTVGADRVGDALVSTVFLGINHAFAGGPPMLFETMIFGGSNDRTMQRCSTWEQAEAMHARWVALLRDRKVPD